MSAHSFSNLGDGLRLVAIPWLASAITREPMLIALATAAVRVPWLVFSLPAGVITDRVDRRLLVAWMDVAGGVTMLAFAGVVLANQASIADPAALAWLMLLVIGFRGAVERGHRVPAAEHRARPPAGAGELGVPVLREWEPKVTSVP
nr:MFS transporter [Haloechinothrix alba]